ncbi:IRG-type G domain-containing protein [Mucor velutinosus]|uniref:Coronin n=1 Tax=Mucor velutinosus TaxID=708070 RepID=A0AAN7I3Q3_9FUNG|nr:IRG-type G domain-containing protein [Mucor velutinosus]
MAQKAPPKFGSANASVYKYIAGKFYHPSTRYEDLQGLSINKSGECELIQANTKFIAVPLSGPGGRVSIINSEKPGRLPIHIPSVLCNSEVSNFKFDPFNENILVTVSMDNKIRVWEIPEGGIEEDIAEPKCVFGSSSMDKVHLIEFHPTTKDILLTTSDDLGHPTVRIWDVQAQKEEIVLKGQHKDVIFSCAWSPDGTHIATTSKDKKLRVLDARTGEIVAEGPSHNSIRPSRLVWLDNQLLVSVGFGLGSSREVLLMSKEDLSKPLCRKTIDISPSIMSAYYDPDCHILFVAGRGDRTIHTYHLEEDRQLTAVAKIEGTTLQQGFAFLPKKTCHVKDIEIDRFYRLTPNSIEPVGVRVPRARPEFFQDDIFVPTLDLDHPAQEAANWFKGDNKQLGKISLQPEDMSPLSTAPPPASQAQSQAKFEMGKKFVSEEQRKKEQMERMFAAAKNIEGDDEVKPKPTNPEDEEVAEDEWDD